MTGHHAIYGEHGGVVSSLRLFRGLSAATIGQALSNARIRHLDKGALLFLEGEATDRLYVVLTGWVEVFKNAENGEEGTLRVLGCGDTVLGSAVFLNTPFPVSARAAKQATLLSIPASPLRECVKRDNDLALNFLETVSLESQFLITQLDSSRQKAAEQRIGWFLLKLLLGQGRLSCSVTLPYNKTLIASYLNMRRETLSRALKRMSRKGIKIDNRTVVLPNPGALCGFCDHTTANICSARGKPGCRACDNGDAHG